MPRKNGILALVQQIQRQAINKQDQKKQRDASPDNF